MKADVPTYWPSMYIAVVVPLPTAVIWCQALVPGTITGWCPKVKLEPRNRVR